MMALCKSREVRHQQKKPCMDQKKFGERVRDFRIFRGWEQKDLAEKALTSVPTISRIESGTQNFAIEMVFRLAEALDIMPKELFGDGEVSFPEEAALYVSLFRSTRNLPESLLKSVVTMMEEFESALRQTEPTEEGQAVSEKEGVPTEQARPMP